MQAKDTNGLKVAGTVSADPLRNLGAFALNLAQQKKEEEKAESVVHV